MAHTAHVSGGGECPLHLALWRGMVSRFEVAPKLSQTGDRKGIENKMCGYQDLLECKLLPKSQTLKFCSLETPQTVLGNCPLCERGRPSSGTVA